VSNRGFEGVSDFCRESLRHAAILCVAVRNSGSRCRAAAVSVGEKAPMKDEVCSTICTDLKMSGISGAESACERFCAMLRIQNIS
jgi:hypothetical protein